MCWHGLASCFRDHTAWEWFLGLTLRGNDRAAGSTGLGVFDA